MSERFEANAAKFPDVKLVKSDKGVTLQFPGTDADAAHHARAQRSRRAPGVDGQNRHRPSSGRRLARQLRLRIAGGAGRGVEPLSQRLPVGTVPRRAPLFARSPRCRCRTASSPPKCWPKRWSAASPASWSARCPRASTAAISTTHRSTRSGKRPPGSAPRWSCIRCSCAASRGSRITISSTRSAASSIRRSPFRACCSPAICSSTRA